MTTKNTPPAKTPSEVESVPEQRHEEETPFEAVASICSVLVVGLFILTFHRAEFRDSLRVDGEDAAGGRSPGGGPHHAGAADQVDAAGALSRAEARRHRGVHQAGRTGRGRQADDSLPGEAADRRSRRSYSSAQWHRDREWSGAEPSRMPCPPRRRTIATTSTIFRQCP